MAFLTGQSRRVLKSWYTGGGPEKGFWRWRADGINQKFSSAYGGFLSQQVSRSLLLHEVKNCMTFLSYSPFSAQISNDTWLLLKVLFSVKYQKTIFTSTPDFHNLLLFHNNLLRSSKPRARLEALGCWAASRKTWRQYIWKTSPSPAQNNQIKTKMNFSSGLFAFFTFVINNRTRTINLLCHLVKANQTN